MAQKPQPSDSLEVSPAKSRLSMLIRTVSTVGVGSVGLTLMGVNNSALLWVLVFLGVAACLAASLFVLPLVVGIFTHNDKQSLACKYYFAQLMSLLARRTTGT